jgi:hypothetical protein
MRRRRASASARAGGEVPLLQVGHELFDHALDQRVLVAEVLDLDHQALFQRARRDADRIELLHARQHALDVLDPEHRGRARLVLREVLGLLALGEADGDVLERLIAGEEAAVVERADDLVGDLEIVLDQVRHRELPGEVIEERVGLGQRLLDRRQILAVAADAAGHRGRRVVVVEPLLPVDLVGGRRVGGDLGRLVGLGDRLDLGLGLLAADGVLGVDGVVVGAQLLFEDGVLFELGVDGVDELQAVELKQADGLLQLRRHDELLCQLEAYRLTELERHCSPSILRAPTRSKAERPFCVVILSDGIHFSRLDRTAG